MYNQINANKRKTWFLISIFTGFVIAMGFIFSQSLDYGPIAIVISIIIALSISLFGYYKGDSVALRTSGAQHINRNDNPYLFRMVENLTIASGIPMPEIYIINDSSPNAFATGRDPKHSSIALTSGILSLLKNEELEGVIAHELSHIKNYDIRVMTMVIVLVGLVALMADIFLRMQFFGGMGARRSRSQGKAGAVIFIVGILLAVLSPIIAKLIQLAVSRKREFLADASGALLTRYPQGLAAALRKISSHSAPLKRANHATAHLFFSSPFGNSRKFLHKLFMTHPPIKERIKILENMI